MSVKGIIFDIQRFSLHDGPGIRTTVFLKGCPLQCLWCHNPESQLLRPQLLYKKSKCVNCLACTAVCPEGAHQVKNGIHIHERSLCKGNLKCAEACNYSALKKIGYETDALAIFKEVETDVDYYRNSGGGLTVSGGEPMLQFRFLLDLLRLAKVRNIHTCIETCGYAEQEKYRQAADLTDIFLFDIKALNSAVHKELTGVPNDLILSNLEFLYGSNAQIILRCPLIQGINDSDLHLEGIAGLERKYPRLKGIDILPFHDMGKGKWEEAGLDYSLKGVKGADEAVKYRWMNKLHKLGCEKVRLG